MRHLGQLGVLTSALCILGCVDHTQAGGDGWLRWRGPVQSGVSLEGDLPDSIDVADARWTLNLTGRGTPVIADGRVFLLGYEGEGPDLEQMILCLDERTGRRIWEHRYKDFLSDTVYNRYCISSPSIDPETGNVYFTSTEGILNCFSRDGELIWQVSMIESYGMTTYPNGRTVSPLIDGDLAITHNMSAAWGPLGPARNRFYAFDKRTGEHVWTSNPDGAPKDNPYSYPVFEWRDGRRMLYAGLAGGAMTGVNARTGEAAWWFNMSVGGVCASPLLFGDQLIVTHARENLDSSTLGRTLAIRLGAYPEAGESAPLPIGAEYEAWRIDQLGAFSSSPVLVGDRMYLTTDKGELAAVDVSDGTLLWQEKLAPDQIHASPLYGDGKLYVPMNNGLFFVIRPTDEGPEILSKTQLEGNCLAAPAIWNGKVYIHTTAKLYCFGNDSGTWIAEAPAAGTPQPGAATTLQVIPADITVSPGEPLRFRARTIDRGGNVVEDSIAVLEWGANPLGVTFDADGHIANTASARPGAAAIPVQAAGLSTTVRLRVTYPMPFEDNFDAAPRTPGHWLGSGPKWEVSEMGGEKVLARTINNPLFQRAIGFFGQPHWSEYTIQADVMSEGRRRNISTVGLINQRYMVQLKGNYQEIEINSNVERVKHSVPFPIQADVWYTLKTRCDNNTDGSVTIRAKAWPRDESEPADWTIEYTHAKGHQHGAAGIYGFTFLDRFRVFVDNLRGYPNE